MIVIVFNASDCQRERAPDFDVAPKHVAERTTPFESPKVFASSSSSSSIALYFSPKYVSFLGKAHLVLAV